MLVTSESILKDQESLLVHLTTVFGDSDLILRSLRGREAISELFEFKIVFASKNKALDAEKAIGSKINIAIKSDSQERYIDGIVAEFSQGATETENEIFLTEYAATIRPALWLLDLDKNCLMFQNKTAIDIIKKVLQDCGVKDVDDKTKSCGKVQREYCVQYDESSFNFISRLMEDEGIFYFFSHSKNKHTLVLADAASAYEKMPKTPKMGFTKNRREILQLGKVFNTSMTTAVRTGSYASADYNYTISQTKLYSKLDTKWKGLVYYEYPGCFGKAKEGDDLSKLRVQLFEANHCLLKASSTAANVTAGFSFEIFDHHVDKFNSEYVALEASHFLNFSSSSGYVYRNDFQAFEKGVEFRAPRRALKPRIYGTQTAIVVCPSGEEIFRNEHCCVKVHFHWDQIGKKADASDSSCWIRVVQLLAGSGWGAIYIPRVGQEVVVAFLEGDPDRPLVVGCVYNDQYMPAYSDKEATKSTLKTVTFKDEKGFNEFRVNDEKDKEEIFVHAQKDMYIDIIHSRKTEIEKSNDTLDLFKGSRTITLKADGDDPANHSLFLKKGDQIVELTKGNRSVTLKEGDHNFTITKGGETISLGDGNRSITLKKGDMSYEVKGDYTLKVSGNLTIKVDGDIKIEAGKNANMKSGQNFDIKGGQNLGAEAGMAMTLKSGTDFTGKAGTALSLKSGTDFKAESGLGLVLKAGLNLEASANLNLNLKANVMLEAKGSASAKISGAMVEVAGQGMTKVSAPMITIGGGMLQLG
ncbi:MAG: type VI secretion system tip protein VgrG [Holosporaceae bacterium]|jgi:type VI secretion system secreted protein VgrG|nr:type VI secretion system tip protein VgrG [Holosporaceae bacterium]